MSGYRIRQKYPDKVPVVVERVKGNDCPLLDKNKYLVTNDLTVSQFLYVLRRRLAHKLSSKKALFLFIGSAGVLVNTSTLFSQLYDAYKDDKDGILYLTYSTESTFG